MGYRPMRSSGSATGLRRRRRAGTSRRWGCRRRSIRCWEQRRRLAESDGFLLTGRLSLAEAGWLRDHAVFETVLLPGTGLLELGFAAARAVGLTTVSQLTLVSPLVLPAEGAVRLQVQLDGPEAGEEGRRALEHLQPCGRCARGSVVDAACAGRAELGAVEQEAAAEETGLEASGLEIWPPAGGEPIDLTGHYAALAARGYGYGPSFQGLCEAWRVGDVVYGRAVLPEALSSSAEEYGLHPALLDSALHVLGFDPVGGAGDAGDGSRAAAVRVVGGDAGCDGRA